MEATGLNLKVVAVGWGFHQPCDLEPAGADAVVTTGAALKVCLHQGVGAVDTQSSS